MFTAIFRGFSMRLNLKKQTDLNKTNCTFTTHVISTL